MIAVGAGMLEGCVSADYASGVLDTQISEKRTELALEQSRTEQLEGERNSLEAQLGRLQSKRRKLLSQPESPERNSSVQAIDGQISVIEAKLKKLKNQL